MSITAPTPIFGAFASGGTFTTPPTTTSTTLCNQVDGWPSIFSTPVGTGGSLVTRQDMNGVFNLYSNLLLWINAGGTFTFNENISDNNSGYPAGIILYSYSDNTWQRSLVANNTANFVTTPSYLNDGINWTSAFNCGDLNALSITSAGDITAENIISNTVTSPTITCTSDLIANEIHITGNNWATVINYNNGVSFETVNSSLNGGFSMLLDSSNSYAPTISFQNGTNTSNSYIASVPGYRPTLQWYGQAKTGIITQSDVTYVTNNFVTAQISLNSSGTYNVVMSGVIGATSGSTFSLSLPLSYFGLSNIVDAYDYVGTICIDGTLTGFSGTCIARSSGLILAGGSVSGSSGTYNVCFSIVFVATK